MNWIEGCDRAQICLLPATVEDYVGPDNAVRFMDAFVEHQDLRALGFQFPKENHQNRGRPAYHPKVLLKLYIYCYLYRIRASRRMELECSRNLEVIWLVGELKPDFKTIADFRKDNAEAFKAVMRQFNKICQQLDLFGGQLLAIDGTKIKGQNSPAKNWSHTKLEKKMGQLDQRLEEYLEALDQADKEEPAPVAQLSAAELERKIKQLKEKKQQVQAKLEMLKQLGQSQLSATDPESRSMKGAHGHVVGYNVQAAVDAKNHLLVSAIVTNSPVDQGQLAPIAQAAKEELQIASADVVADGGYFKAEDIKTCQEMGLEPQLPQVNNSPSERAGLFGKKHFTYDPLSDSYLCPTGLQLNKRREMTDKGRRLFNYDNPSACAGCSLKSRCTEAKFRTVSRWEHESALERMAAKVAAEPENLVQRKTLIEHCWGTIKWLLPEGFLLKGIKKVGAELSLAHFAYNLKRALKIVGLAKLLEALTKPQPPVGPNKLKSALGPVQAINATLQRVFSYQNLQFAYN
jgi:transposase